MKARKPSWSPRHQLSVVITNTNPLLLTWLQTTFGGSVFLVKTNHLGKRQIMRWQLNERQAFTALEMCLPYFVTKKQQAEVGIAFQQLKDKNWSRKKVSDEVIAKRDQLKHAIERFNSVNGGAPVSQTM